VSFLLSLYPLTSTLSPCPSAAVDETRLLYFHCSTRHTILLVSIHSHTRRVKGHDNHCLHCWAVRGEKGKRERRTRVKSVIAIAIPVHPYPRLSIPFSTVFLHGDQSTVCQRAALQRLCSCIIQSSLPSPTSTFLTHFYHSPHFVIHSHVDPHPTLLAQLPLTSFIPILHPHFAVAQQQLIDRLPASSQ
jgi:hypothetical protein